MSHHPIRDVFDIIRAEDDNAWQALDYLNLYRFFVSMLLITICYTPIAEEILNPDQLQGARLYSLLHTLLSINLVFVARRIKRSFTLQVILSFITDLTTLVVMIRQMGGVDSGAGVLMIGSVMMSGVLLKRKGAMFYAAITSLLMIWLSTLELLNANAPLSDITSTGTLGIVYFTVAMIGSILSRRTMESETIATQSAERLLDMQRLNELIVEQMNNGILLIKAHNNIHLLNHAAFHFLGRDPGTESVIHQMPEPLMAEYQHWSTTGMQRGHPLQLSPTAPETIARFARLGIRDTSDRLIFLEDAGLVSERAQQIALVSLGKLSATIAHEIRNPLAAISHSAQLLAESTKLSDSDIRLSSIIGKHCRRMNDIIENVLQLARQKDADIEPMDLGMWLRDFIQEFTETQNLTNTHIDLKVPDYPTPVIADSSQLQQVLWNLLQNAMRHGAVDGQTSILIALEHTDLDEIDLVVADQGPGIADDLAEQIFQPFFTTCDDGSGLGLYLCQQLCTANRIQLTLQQREGQGCTFVLRFNHRPANHQPTSGYHNSEA